MLKFGKIAVGGLAASMLLQFLTPQPKRKALRRPVTLFCRMFNAMKHKSRTLDAGVGRGDLTALSFKLK